ncbi:MAG: beta-galactosidase [Abditibacteriota bacterium]|nr:beta-galactosidase [Abditibacteriota bacterium]
MKILILSIILFVFTISIVSAEKKLIIEDGRFYKEGKPFFPFGYVFGRTDDDMKRLKKAHANSVHTEFSFLDLYPESDKISEEGIREVQKIFDNANNNDLLYFPLLTGHYIPSWFAEKMKDHESPRDANGNSIGLWFVYSLHDKSFKELLRDYWKEIAMNYGNDNNTGAFVLWNEPGYGLDATSTSLSDFKVYLRDKFLTVNNLNDILKTEYKDFDDIECPKDVSNRALWYEWVLFNQISFAEFFEEEVNIIKESAPNAYVTNKHPITAMSGDNCYVNNVALQAKYQDFYGCDLYNGSPMKFRDAFEAARSLSRKSPVVTFEWHQQKGLNEGDADLTVSQMVAQIIGGCRGIMYFHGGDEAGWGIWNEDTNPKAVRERIFDLVQKINEYPEVFSAKREESDIAILYSNHSLIQYGSNPERIGRYKYGNLIEELYSMIRNRHYAVDLIANDHLGNYLFDYKVLIIPSYSILSEEELKIVEEFYKRGGKIMAFGHSLEKTPYFEDAGLPHFYGLKSRQVAPWNADHIVLVDTIDDLRPFMKGEIICHEPEIVDMQPMEQSIPGYIVKTENKQTALVASQDVFPSVIQSNDGNFIYCGFLSTNSEGLGSLLDGLLTLRFGVEKEISVKNNYGVEACEIMTSVCNDDGKKVIMILNPTKLGGEWTFEFREWNVSNYKDVITGKNVNIKDGKFKLKLNPGEYVFLKEK